ncbi:putative acetyltransferase [Nostocoides japonicum T1-X7]|uniref:Putative acetyltransferase n=2 Tax=Nostocoides japonicum TaxID=99481 RepID=A0A077LU23_9MICO|nr:putative acetyltransferase [Tetrasphaera japonica T1-X7]
MISPTGPISRDAGPADIDQLLLLWGLLFGETAEVQAPWRGHARRWFQDVAESADSACVPVIAIGGTVVACAVGTLQSGVPNPLCPRGRAVHLANVVTLPEHRRCGHGSALVDRVVRWARSIDADRVDLSATAEGQSIYARAGFTPTTAPRMKLIL